MSERIKCTECEYYDATPTTLIIRGKRVKAKGWCTRDDCILNEGRYAEVGRIVRCKDCKYCEDESYTDEDTGKEVKYLVCDRWYEQDDADGNMFPKADDFCSRGERAE